MKSMLPKDRRLWTVDQLLESLERGHNTYLCTKEWHELRRRIKQVQSLLNVDVRTVVVGLRVAANSTERADLVSTYRDLASAIEHALFCTKKD